MADLLAAFNLSARRLCHVRVLDAAQDKVVSQGTGFLIGLHTVLTCWHVVAPLLERATGNMLEGSFARLSCTFERLGAADGRTHPVQENWLVGFSPAPRQPGDPQPQAFSPDGTFLDYCAIRLRGAPGRERGFYDLAAFGGLDHKDDNFFVFQHPAGVPQRAGFARNTRLDDHDPNHLRHEVWTASGSSGGLCLNNRLQPVAMHRAAARVRNAQGQVTQHYNLAVLLKSIHAARPDLGDPRLGDPQGLNDRLWRLADGSRAVVGRLSSQSTLRQMALRPDPAILVVQGPKESGKSFSTALLRDSLPIETRIIIELSATELPARALDLARMILARAGMPAARIDAALAAPGNLTTAAATVAGIFNAMKRVLLEMARADPTQARTLWLVIDELDVARLPGIGARMLLDRIYSDEELRAVLRVVLIGLKDTLTGVGSNLIGFDTLPDPAKIDAGDVESCLDGLTVGVGKVPDVGQSRRHARLVIGAAEVLAEEAGRRSRLALLSGYLSRVYMKALEEW
nr:serine protease [Rhodobacter calidifons]